LRCLLNVPPLKLALSAKCFIYRVTNWPLFILFIFSCLLHRSIRVFERDGLEGSCRKFGLWADLQRLRHVPESEGTVCVWSLNLIRNYNYNQSVFFLHYYQSRLFLYD
jgi:hypothetical protein